VQPILKEKIGKKIINRNKNELERKLNKISKNSKPSSSINKAEDTLKVYDIWAPNNGSNKLVSKPILLNS
jgi:hypothetical protein